MSTLWQGLGLTGMLVCIPFLSTNTARVRLWLKRRPFINQPQKKTQHTVNGHGGHGLMKSLKRKRTHRGCCFLCWVARVCKGFLSGQQLGKVLLWLWLVQGERFMIWLIIYGKAGILVVLFFINLGNVSELFGEGCVLRRDDPSFFSLSLFFFLFYKPNGNQPGQMAGLLLTSLYLSDGDLVCDDCFFLWPSACFGLWNEACSWSGGMIRYRVVFAGGMGWPVFSFCKLAISEDICPSRIYDISQSISV